MSERRYRVYVIRLDESVWAVHLNYREANPQYQAGNPHVYVGSTGRTPEERLVSHRQGGRHASRIVTLYGKELLHAAYEALPTYPDRTSAEVCEQELAEALKGLGWGVWYNAGPLNLREE